MFYGRLYPQEHYFLVKDTEKSNSLHQCNKLNTQKDQWTQCKAEHEVRFLSASVFVSGFHVFSFLFPEVILFDAVSVHFVI